jgi:hypothetical protein
MLAEQATQNAAKVEEAYGGFAQREFQFLLLSFLFFSFHSGPGEFTWVEINIEIYRR